MYGRIQKEFVIGYCSHCLVTVHIDINLQQLTIPHTHNPTYEFLNIIFFMFNIKYWVKCLSNNGLKKKLEHKVLYIFIECQLLRKVMAFEREFFCTLVVLILIWQRCQPEGRRQNRWCPGCEGSDSEMIFSVHFLVLELYRSSSVGSLT